MAKSVLRPQAAASSQARTSKRRPAAAKASLSQVIQKARMVHKARKLASRMRKVERRSVQNVAKLKQCRKELQTTKFQVNNLFCLVMNTRELFSLHNRKMQEDSALKTTQIRLMQDRGKDLESLVHQLVDLESLVRHHNTAAGARAAGCRRCRRSAAGEDAAKGLICRIDRVFAEARKAARASKRNMTWEELEGLLLFVAETSSNELDPEEARKAEEGGILDTGTPAAPPAEPLSSMCHPDRPGKPRGNNALGDATTLTVLCQA